MGKTSEQGRAVSMQRLCCEHMSPSLSLSLVKHLKVWWSANIREARGLCMKVGVCYVKPITLYHLIVYKCIPCSRNRYMTGGLTVASMRSDQIFI